MPILEAAYATPGVAAQRKADKQVSKGSGCIDTINAFATGSITFYVSITQTVTSARPANTQSDKYAVTVVSSGGGWQVDSIELSNLGNFGNS
jgi:hypothetical protein